MISTTFLSTSNVVMSKIGYAFNEAAGALNGGLVLPSTNPPGLANFASNSAPFIIPWSHVVSGVENSVTFTLVFPAPVVLEKSVVASEYEGNLNDTFDIKIYCNRAAVFTHTFLYSSVNGVELANHVALAELAIPANTELRVVITKTDAAYKGYLLFSALRRP